MNKEIKKLADSILTKHETPKCTCGGFPDCICNHGDPNGLISNGTNLFTRKEAIDAMEELVNTIVFVNGNEAIEFAEWLAEKASSTLEKDKWLDELLMEKRTAEMYKIFKAEKENAKRNKV